MTWLKKVLDEANRQFEQLPEWKKHSDDRFLQENQNCKKGAVMKAKIPDDLKEYYRDAKRRAGGLRNTEMGLIERIANLDESLAEAKAIIKRQHDLIRHVRSELPDANLISEEEYAALAEDSGSVARLETYDQMRSTIAQLRQSLISAQHVIERLVAPMTDKELKTHGKRVSELQDQDGYDLNYTQAERIATQEMLAARAQKGQENGI